MSNLPFFLTNDLEVTSGIPQENIGALLDIRLDTLVALNRAFSMEVPIRIISHKEGSNFLEISRSHDEFIVATDGGIYIQNPDIAFDSTRMYPDERSILEDKKAYRILTRDGKPLDMQETLSIPDEHRGNVGIYDDGLFSGDTLKAVLSNLPNGVTQYKINVLLNFSGKDTINGININSLYSGDCTDWIDERDFYYGVKNSGASINPNGIVSGVPYISSPKMVSQKASIPKNMSKEFCLSMLDINMRLWKIIDENIRLDQVPRLAYLMSKYPKNISMQEVLLSEKITIQTL